MSTDFRALCAELLDELVARPLCLDHALIDRARAALAEPFRPIPMPEGARTLQVLLAVGAECAGGSHLSTEQCRLATDLLAQAFPGSTARYLLSEPADGPAAVAGQPSPTQTPANGPTRQELRQLFRDQSGYIDDEQVMWIDDFCAAASVVLARWGNLKAGLTSSPAEGEVAELVAWLHGQDGGMGRRAIYARIADLLERQAAPVPVAGPADGPPPEGEVSELAADRLRIVAAGIRYGYMAGHNDTVEGCYGDPDELAADEALVILGELDASFESMLQQLSAAAPAPVPVGERLPGPEDCDESGMCWWLHAGEDGIGDWIQRKPYPGAIASGFFRMTHWLPAHALPLPASGGEVQP